MNLKISRMLGVASRARKYQIPASLSTIGETDVATVQWHAARQPTGSEPSSRGRAAPAPAPAPSRQPVNALEWLEEDMIFNLSGCETANES